MWSGHGRGTPTEGEALLHETLGNPSNAERERGKREKGLRLAGEKKRVFTVQRRVKE